MPLTHPEPVVIDRELDRLVAVASRVLNEHLDVEGRCPICREQYPCERVILAANTIAYQ